MNVPKDGFVMVPMIGTEVRSSHPQTCLNPDPTFVVIDVKVDHGKFYARGENTCWFSASMLTPAAAPPAQEAKDVFDRVLTDALTRTDGTGILRVEYVDPDTIRAQEPGALGREAMPFGHEIFWRLVGTEQRPKPRKPGEPDVEVINVRRDIGAITIPTPLEYETVSLWEATVRATTTDGKPPTIARLATPPAAPRGEAEPASYEDFVRLAVNRNTGDSDNG